MCTVYVARRAIGGDRLPSVTFLFEKIVRIQQHVRLQQTLNPDDSDNERYKKLDDESTTTIQIAVPGHPRG